MTISIQAVCRQCRETLWSGQAVEDDGMERAIDEHQCRGTSVVTRDYEEGQGLTLAGMGLDPRPLRGDDLIEVPRSYVDFLMTVLNAASDFVNGQRIGHIKAEYRGRRLLHTIVPLSRQIREWWLEDLAKIDKQDSTGRCFTCTERIGRSAPCVATPKHTGWELTGEDPECNACMDPLRYDDHTCKGGFGS